MRICILGDAWSIHIKKWARFFIERGHEVHIISKGDSDETLEGLDIHIIKKKNHGSGIISEMQNYISLSNQTKSIVKRIEPDLINAHYASVYGAIASSIRFHPYVVTVWGSDVFQDVKKSIQVRYSVRRALKKADRITIATDYLEQYLVKDLGISRDTIMKIKWGIDLSIFHKGYEMEVEKMREHLKIPSKSQVILSNRSMSPIYNIRTIIESIPKVLNEIDDAVFILIKGFGDDEYLTQMENLVKESRFGDRVRILTRQLSQYEMAIFNNMSDAFISIPNSDQFCLTILEGMVCGSIPIVSQLKSYTQYLKNDSNAIFVDQSDSDKLAKGIIKALGDINLMENSIEKNIKIVEENENWNINARKMEMLFKELIHGK
jgi:glycosyltransferase involved in cell wall biosynthesis